MRSIFCPAGARRSTLRLELHYDDVHFERWKGTDNKAPPRKGTHKLFGRIVRARKQKLFQQLELPGVVKDILQTPRCEENIDKLEELRKAILSVVVGEAYIQVDCEEAAQLAGAIQRCTIGRFGEVGKGCDVLPAGARVMLDARNKAELIEKVKAIDPEFLKVHMYPFGT